MKKMNKKVRIRGNRKKLYTSIMNGLMIRIDYIPEEDIFEAESYFCGDSHAYMPMHKNCRIFDEHIKFNFVSTKDSKQYFDDYILKRLEEMRKQ